jgi:hypothetical protein
MSQPNSKLVIPLMIEKYSSFRKFFFDYRLKNGIKRHIF